MNDLNTTSTNTSSETIADFLKKAVVDTLGEKVSAYFTDLEKGLEGKTHHRTFFMAFGSAPRKLGKGLLAFTEESTKEAHSISPEWAPWTWEVDEALRVWLILQIPVADKDVYVPRIMEIYETADMRELAAIMKALPFTAYPEEFVRLGEEGVRTNMSNVLEAIALHNAYPERYFNENSWNQMFLKCIFTDRTIYKIWGIDKRNNQELSRIITDYAHERWAASRTVTPEIWRPVAPFLGKEAVGDIEKVINNENPIQQIAAALVCRNSKVEEIRQLLDSRKDLSQRITEEKLDWDWVGKAWEQQNIA